MTITMDDDTNRMLADAAQDFLQRGLVRHRMQAIYRGESVIDRGFWRQMADQGWLSMRLPEALGGAGMQLKQAAIVAECLGAHATPEPFIACAVMPAVIASALSPSDHLKEIRQGLMDGRHVCAVAWQSHAQAMDPAATSVSATASDVGYRLDGHAYGVVAASFADSFLVTATLNNTLGLWFVRKESSGLMLHDRITSDGSTVSVVNFKGVELRPSDLLAQGQPLEDVLISMVDEATLLVAWQLVGLATEAFRLTLEYMRNRVQFGHPIGSFQALQHLAVDVRVQQALARAACAKATPKHADEHGRSTARAAIAAAKARASDAALLAIRFGVQAHGAMGFAAEADIGLYFKSALRLAAWLGNGTQQRRQHARLTGLHGEPS